MSARRSGALAGLALAALLAVGHSTTHEDTSTASWDVDTASDQPAPCTSVDAYSLTDPEVSRRIAQGWYGDPTDGQERLYAPSC